MDHELQLSGAQERVRKLENERRNYETNRSDILGQLQDALLREQDLRQTMTHLEKDISELKEDNKNAELHINQDDLKMNRLFDQVRVLESKLADARDLDNARQQVGASYSTAALSACVSYVPQ
jgi:chromosome segregation ATPase